MSHMDRHLQEVERLRARGVLPTGDPPRTLPWAPESQQRQPESGEEIQYRDGYMSIHEAGCTGLCRHCY